MTEKNLILKLKNLANISPDEAWLKSNRELLFSQISNSGATQLSVWQNFVINLRSFTKAAAQPVYAFGIFVFALGVTSIFSHQLLSQAKPNDTLYIARILSEKAKINTVINPESRNKLAMQFANERAQEISAVLADPNFNNEENKDAVAKLNTSFNEEIETVKSRIKNIVPLQNATPSVAANINSTINSDAVSIAENNKDAGGVQLLENPNNKIIVNSNSKIETSSVLKKTTSTSTLNLSETATTTKDDNKDVNKDALKTDTILDEAQKLFSEKDYTKALDKLKEVNEILK